MTRYRPQKSIKYHRKIQRLTSLFDEKKAELAAGYQGYHEILGFVDHCRRFGITDRGQEKALDHWIDLLERWPFVGGVSTGPLSRQQRERTMVKHYFICTTCGRTADEVHHTVSRSKGGRNKADNLIPLCFECHAKIHGKR